MNRKASLGQVKPFDRHGNGTMLTLAQIHLFLFTTQSSLQANLMHRKERCCRSLLMTQIIIVRSENEPLWVLGSTKRSYVPDTPITIVCLNSDCTMIFSSVPQWLTLWAPHQAKHFSEATTETTHLRGKQILSWWGKEIHAYIARFKKYPVNKIWRKTWRRILYYNIFKGKAHDHLKEEVRDFIWRNNKRLLNWRLCPRHKN